MNKYLACFAVLAVAFGSSSARENYNKAGSVSARSASSATSQVLDCYDYTSQGGDRLRAIDYIPNLSNYNFDNRVSSCCFTGVWLLYAEADYNDRNTGAPNYWAYGNNFCSNVPAAFDNTATSLRYTGAPDGWEYDVLNLYFNDFFIGGEEFMYQDSPQLNYDNRAKSVIVTGCSAWTIYSGNNYSGDSMCVWPKDTTNCYPGFYTTSSSLGRLGGQVSSARKGCFSKNTMLPDNYDDEITKNEDGSFGVFKAREA